MSAPPEERIPYDPALEKVPDFSIERHARERRYLINDEDLPDITTNEQAAEYLLLEWAKDNRERKETYNRQQEADRALEMQRRQQDQEAAKLAQAEADRQREEDLAKKEKKRQPVYAIDHAQSVGIVLPRFSPYVMEKARAREYIELAHFLPEYQQNFGDQPILSSEESRLEFSEMDDGRITLQRSTASSARRVPPDMKLTWTQILTAQKGLIEALQIGNYPNEVVLMFMEFFVVMLMCNERVSDFDNKAMVRYAHIARREWHDRMMYDGVAFNLALFDKDLYQRCKDMLRTEQQDANNERQVPQFLPVTEHY
jgi:hypothetical protein